MNIIRATEIFRDYRFYCRSYTSTKDGMKTHHVFKFIARLIKSNPEKELYIIIDNYRAHKSVAKEYGAKYSGRIHFIFLPTYCPELNPQENVWKWLKDCCASYRAHSTVKKLSRRINKFQVYTYNTPS